MDFTTLKPREKLALWLGRTGLTQSEFAPRIPVDRARLSRWITGAALPNKDERARLDALTDGAVKAGEW